MNKITATLAIALVALSTATFAQDRLPDPGTDAARQERMNDAYREHREAAANRDTHEVRHTIREDTHEAGHAIHNGVRATGHAIHRGVRATGHAIHHGVRATGHAIHRGVDKVTGHP
jgi:hypothetical protein